MLRTLINAAAAGSLVAAGVFLERSGLLLELDEWLEQMFGIPVPVRPASSRPTVKVVPD